MSGVLDGLPCSAAAAEIGEEPEATAPHAVAWLGLVVAGAWARDATALLPARLRDALVDVPGVRAVVLRPAGVAPTDVGLLLAGTVPGSSWLRHVAADEVDSALDTLVADSAAQLRSMGQGREVRLGRPRRSAAVLVCTNGTRDACCARLGRPAVAAMTAGVGQPLPGRLRQRPTPADVWESSHLGGHRFAPTAAVLPAGMLYGGLGSDPAALVAAVADVIAGRTVLDGYRGRSTYPVHAQAAEAAVRRHLAVVGTSAGPDDVRVDGMETLLSADMRVPVASGAPGPGDASDAADGDVVSTHRVLVRHSGGRTFRVVVRRVRTGTMRPASCGAEPTPVDAWVTDVDADAPTGLYLPGL